MIQEIAMKGVIDQFMLLQPGTREILWNRSLDHEGTIERMELHAKSLSLDMDVDTWMAKEGYVFTHATTKRRHWRRGTQTLSSKTTPDFTERLGPNNGFMRVFFHDVATKLRTFHPGYGWDEGLVAALYRAGGQEMTLVHRAYEKNWTEEESPRGWVLAMFATNDLCAPEIAVQVLPQMHYLGIYMNDIASGPDQNFGIAVGEPKMATPVDLDAVWRGDLASGTTFLKLMPPEDAIVKMRDDYLHIR
jgi:hypothetical protein